MDPTNVVDLIGKPEVVAVLRMLSATQINRLLQDSGYLQNNITAVSFINMVEYCSGLKAGTMQFTYNVRYLVNSDGGTITDTVYVTWNTRTNLVTAHLSWVRKTP